MELVNEIQTKDNLVLAKAVGVGWWWWGCQGSNTVPNENRKYENIILVNTKLIIEKTLFTLK